MGRNGERQGEAGSGAEKIATAEVGCAWVDAFGHGSALPRSALDRADDFQISAAAADIAVHVLDDLRARRRLIARQSVAGLHDLAGLAVAALRPLLRGPRLCRRSQ